MICHNSTDLFAPLPPSWILTDEVIYQVIVQSAEVTFLVSNLGKNLSPG